MNRPEGYRIDVLTQDARRPAAPQFRTALSEYRQQGSGGLGINANEPGSGASMDAAFGSPPAAHLTSRTLDVKVA